MPKLLLVVYSIITPMRAFALTGLIAYPIITSGCALAGLIVYSLVQITFMATVFTNASIVAIAHTLLDFAWTLSYLILLPYIQLYSTAINAAFNAAATPQLLLCYAPVIYQ